MEVVNTGTSNIIRVVVINSNKDIRIRKVRYKENRAQMDKKSNWEVTFKGDEIGRVWVRVPPTFRHRYMPAIVVREGSNKAMSLSAAADYVPPLTQQENSEMIKHKIAQAISKGGRLLTMGQFIAIMLGLGVIIVLLVANMSGVHIGVGTAPTPTPTGIGLP